MAEAFHIRRDGPLLRVGFGDPHANDAIIRSAHIRLQEMIRDGELAGGGVLGVTGPASIPVIVTIAHAVLHRFAVIAVFDPKLDRYVVASSHDPELRLGDLLTEVQLRLLHNPIQEESR